MLIGLALHPRIYRCKIRLANHLYTTNTSPVIGLQPSPLSNHLPVRDGLAFVSTGVVTPRGSALFCSLLLSPPPNGLCELAALRRLVLEDFGIAAGADETVRIAAGVIACKDTESGTARSRRQPPVELHQHTEGCQRATASGCSRQRTRACSRKC